MERDRAKMSFSLTPAASLVLALAAENPNVPWDEVRPLIERLETPADFPYLRSLVEDAVRVLKNEPATGPYADAAGELAQSYRDWARQKAATVRNRRLAATR